MGHCKDCRFWDCDAHGYGECCMPSMAEPGDKLQGPVAMVYKVADDHGLDIRLVTAASHSCAAYTRPEEISPC
jgi:hypothetical protein